MGSIQHLLAVEELLRGLHTLLELEFTCATNEEPSGSWMKVSKQNFSSLVDGLAQVKTLVSNCLADTSNPCASKVEDMWVDDSDDDSKIKQETHSDTEDEEMEPVVAKKKRKKRQTDSISLAHTKERKNLKELLHWLCSLQPNNDVMANFDILRGKPSRFYGLQKPPLLNRELATLLLACPQFLHKDNSVFFAQMFNGASDNWRRRLPLYADWIANPTRIQSRLLEELRVFGFQPFDPFEKEEVLVKKEEDINEQGVKVCLQWLTTRANLCEKVNVNCTQKPFNHKDNYYYKRLMLPEMEASGPLAVLGLIVDEPTRTFAQAQVLVRRSDDPASDPNADMEKMHKALVGLTGVSQENFFRSMEVIKQRAGRSYCRQPEAKVKKMLAGKSIQELQDDLAYWKKKCDTLRRPGPRNDVVELKLPADKRLQHKNMIQLQFVPDLDYSKVNNIVLLSGHDPELLHIRSFFGKEGLTKFINEEPLDSRYGQRFSMRQLMKGCLDIYRFFTKIELNEVRDTLPYYAEWWGSTRDQLSQEMNYIRYLERPDNKRVCPTCGKEFTSAKNTSETSHYAEHVKMCALENSNCDCKLTFKSPAEKRRHMLMTHSNQLYMQCPHCSVITKSQRNLNTHIDYYHGVPGISEFCDLCPKSFDSKYHLQIHRFYHENHLCSTCWVEIVGRHQFNKHMRNVHGAGHVCKHCCKVLNDKRNLDKHIKHEHSSRTWAT